MGIAEARKECLARQAVPEPDRETAPKRAVPLLREFIEGEWKEAHFDRYKPSTRKSVHYLLSSRILPEFGSKKLDRMAGAQLSRWFDAFSRTAPGNANHALALLRQIMNFAVACGYIEKNPTQGIRPNRRPRLTRFLSREEIGRLLGLAGPLEAPSAYYMKSPPRQMRDDAALRELASFIESGGL